MKATTIVREEIVEAPVELPPVVPNWDELVEKAEEMAGAIDQHLDYEGLSQGHAMSPERLCPQQRGELTSDLAVICR